MAEVLSKKNHVMLNGQRVSGALVADETGIGIQPKKRLLSNKQPEIQHVFRWDEVVGYRLSASTTGTRPTEIEFKTQTGLYHWRLTANRHRVYERIGGRLSQLPEMPTT